LALNERQKAFADYYIQTGNATEAAIKAGYSEKTARSIGAENLTKPDISAYIRERFDEQSEKRVADANEVIEFYTAVMRGEVKDQFGLDASLSDRLKAGDALMKRYAVTDNGSKGVLEKLDDVLSKIGGNI
jgi:phage terminase small subunit